MDGSGQSLTWFSSENVKMEVPFFQRPYVWANEEWENLKNSIETSNKGSMPFIGSFIFQKKNDDSEYIIIDGQQRITTLSIVIKAYLDWFSKQIPDIKSRFLDIIYSMTLNEMTPIYMPRLIPSEVDKEQFDLVMNNKLEITELDEEKGLIIDAYKFFYNYFSENSEEKNIAIGTKLLSTKKFYIIIIIDENDDEQRIFDSVNSLGKHLDNSDIIKNYLFQKLKNLAEDNIPLQNKVIDHHEKYWKNVFYSDEKRDFWEREKILGRIKSTNLESFLKDFATIKNIYTPSKTGGIDGLAKSYKDHINKINDYGKLVAFVKELADYANSYYEYTNNYENTTSFSITDYLNSTLLFLDKTETTTFNPYIMKIVKEHPDNMEMLLLELQRFLFQRFIFKAKTKNYNNICEGLLSSNDPIAYLRKQNEEEPMGLNEYPSGLKRINNKPATLILFFLEMIRRNGEEDLYSDALQYNKSLEHIMPQKWEKHWQDVDCYKEVEGKSYELIENELQKDEFRKNAIYSIGNMTLITGPLNSSISNNKIDIKINGNEKRGGIKKYAGSLSVAQEIIDVFEKEKKWDERDIIERNKKIFNELNDYYHFIEGFDDLVFKNESTSLPNMVVENFPDMSHYPLMNDDTKLVYEKYNESIMNLQEGINRVYNKWYVAYKIKDSNFVEIGIKIAFIKIRMHLPKGKKIEGFDDFDIVEKNDENGIVSIRVSNEDCFDIIMGKIKDSLEYVKNENCS